MLGGHPFTLTGQANDVLALAFLKSPDGPVVIAHGLPDPISGNARAPGTARAVAPNNQAARQQPEIFEQSASISVTY